MSLLNLPAELKLEIFEDVLGDALDPGWCDDKWVNPEVRNPRKL